MTPATTEERKGNLRAVARQFVRLVVIVRPFWPRLLQLVALSGLLSLLGMVLPYLTKLLVDSAYPARSFSLMELVVLGTLVLGVSSMLIGTLRGYAASLVSSQLHARASLLFFDHLQRLPLRFFEKRRVGEVMSRFTDLRTALQTVTDTFATSLVNGLYLFLVPPLLVILDWKLALIALATLPITSALSLFSARHLQPLWRRSSEASASLNALQVEALSQIRLIKVLALEDEIRARAVDRWRASLAAQMRATRRSQLFSALGAFINLLGTFVFSIYAWRQILKGDLSLGSFLAFQSYIGYIQRPLSYFIGFGSHIQQTAVAFERMFEYLDVESERDGRGAAEVLDFEGNLELRDVTFEYEAGRPAVENISLGFTRGSVTAVVGPSGAGKSTLLRLLLGIETPASGVLLADGIDSSQLSLTAYRQKFGVVWQDAPLLRGTLRDNLTLGIADPAEEVICETLRLCQLEGFVAGLSNGLDTEIGEWGSTVSGGQRQRIAIARALIRTAKVYLFDEATSNLDAQTEALLLPALLQRLSDRTVIFVTHRLGWIDRADRVCFVDAGRIAGLAPHSELVRTCTRYRQFVEETLSPKESSALRLLSTQKVTG